MKDYSNVKCLLKETFDLDCICDGNNPCRVLSEDSLDFFLETRTVYLLVHKQDQIDNEIKRIEKIFSLF